VPTKWDDNRSPLPTVKWMRESELKHGRFAMMAVAGYLAVEFGLRLPLGTKYLGVSPLAAHDVFVKSGDMLVGLLVIGLLEVIGG
jgi:hypothetical protein